MLARAERNGRQWLLKGLAAEYAHDPVYQALLRKEFDISMKLNHPGVVGVVSLEEVPEMGGLCIVEEWIEGQTLDQWLAGHPDTASRIEVLTMLVDTVAHCHKMQIIHRDIKPQNIMIENDGNRVKLIDFGLSDADNYSIFKGKGGTKRYIAPEVLNTSAPPSARTDIYSLGIVMRDMELPRRFKRVIKRCVETNPDNRYSDAQTLLQDIKSLAQARRKTMIIAPVAAIALCAVSWWTGYNVRPSMMSRAVRPSNSLPEQWTIGDTSLAKTDTALTAYFLPSINKTLWITKPGTDKVPGNIGKEVAVDLGLNVKWAPFNMGANCCATHLPGGYFVTATGNVATMLKGNSLGDILDPIESHKSSHSEFSISASKWDVARRVWGNGWRLPTLNEWEELQQKCTWSYVDVPGTLPGYKVTGPDKDVSQMANAGFYWTASCIYVTERDTALFAQAMVMGGNGIFVQRHGTINGFSIRPVLDP